MNGDVPAPGGAHLPPLAPGASPEHVHVPAVQTNGGAHPPSPAGAHAVPVPHEPAPLPRTGESTPPVEFRAQREDYVLWGLIAAVLAFVAFFFWHFTSTSLGWLADQPSANLCTSAESAGLCAISQRYRIAAAGLTAIVVRSNSAFLVGTFVCLLGCTIVLRRVRIDFRAGGNSDTFKARLATDSAGIIIAILGAAILLATTLSHPSLSMEDAATPADGQRGASDAPGGKQRPSGALDPVRRRLEQPDDTETGSDTAKENAK